MEKLIAALSQELGQNAQYVKNIGVVLSLIGILLFCKDKVKRLLFLMVSFIMRFIHTQRL